MMGDQKLPEDRWRPLPKRERGWGFVSVCSPSGLISEALGKPPVGFINRGDQLWKVDLDSYQLLDLASRGHSERWLRDRLRERGFDCSRFEAARDFAVAAGLLVRYGAADGTLKGRRSFAGLTIRRRGYGRQEIEGDRVEVVTPDGVMRVGRFVGGWADWDGKQLADCGVKMLEAGATLPNTIWWPFYQALRSLELGLMWLDGPVDQIGTGLTDNCGHWIRPASLWKQHGDWVARPGNLETAWDGWNILDRTVLSVATAVPMGNCHGDPGFQARNARGEVVDLSQDEYSLLVHSHCRRLVDIGEDLALAAEPDDQGEPMRAFSMGRILQAAQSLEAKRCIFVAKGPAQTEEAAPAAPEQTAA